jgi:hypothetical protein
MGEGSVPLPFSRGELQGGVGVCVVGDERDGGVGLGCVCCGR